MCHLTAAEPDGNLYAVAGSKELLGLVYLGIKIVGINVQGKPGLLIHNTANRRLRLRRDLHEIQVFFLRQIKGIAGGHDPQLLTIGADHTDFLITDLFIDLQFFVCDCKAPPD